ncbi:pentatricopeptide repeat-containing protein At1g26460, mitochondrial-like [Apium graveolens]|uniref:pentatricopeptide repeat-containing protein At1g26460, mitochondrial-like n=1 Tax=Apium graveolens TaxID=4045 RepID=UPI003D7A835D
MIRSVTRIGEGLRRHRKVLAGFQGRNITTEIDSCGYVVNQSDMQNQSTLFSLMMKRYCDTVNVSDEKKIVDVHHISLRRLLENKASKAALKYIDFNLEPGYVMSRDVFTEFVHHCFSKRGEMIVEDTGEMIVEDTGEMNIRKKVLYGKKMDKRLASFIERFAKNNQEFYPSWDLCFYILHMSLDAQNSELAYHALHFIRKFIAAAESSDSRTQYFVEEELIIAVLHLAGESRSSKLVEIACILLDQSLGQNVARADTFVAKICAYASIGNLRLAHDSLFELESLYRGNTEEASDLFSPFSGLFPLVMAYSQNGCGTLDYIHYQLEESSKEDPQYKSLAALNCLILGYANIGDVDRALQTFEAMGTTFGLTHDINSYNCLVSAYLDADERKEALELVEDFKYLGVTPNAMTYELLLKAHVAATDSKSALSVVEEIINSGLEPTRKTLKKIYTCAIEEENDDSKNRVKDLAIKFNISMSKKVFREIDEYAFLAPARSYDKLPSSSWEDKSRFRAQKVSLRSTRRLEAREQQEEDYSRNPDVMFLI